MSWILNAMRSAGHWLVGAMIPLGIRLGLGAVMAAPLVAGLLIIDRTDPPFADEVAIVHRPVPAFTRFTPGDGSLRCEHAAWVPSNAVSCPDGPMVALGDLHQGAIVTDNEVHAVDDQWAIIEVPAATSPPAGGENVWIVGRVPAATPDGPGEDIQVDGVALGIRDNRLVVAVQVDHAARLGPALAADPPTVVAVRAVARPTG